MKPHPLGRGNLYLHLIFIQQHLVVTGSHDFRIPGKGRFPPVLVQLIVTSCGRHHIQANRHPAMQMTEAQYIVEAVIVTTPTLPLVGGIWKEVHHAEGTFPRAEKEPASPSRHDVGIDHVDVVPHTILLNR